MKNSCMLLDVKPIGWNSKEGGDFHVERGCVLM